MFCQARPHVKSLTEGCRFADCGHSAEPGCAVRAAIASGDLPAGRLANYRRLRREAVGVERRAAERRDHRVAVGRRRRLTPRLRDEDPPG